MRKISIFAILLISLCFAITKGNAQYNTYNEYDECDTIDTAYVDTAAVDTVDFDDLDPVDWYNPDYDPTYKVTSVAGVDFGSSRYSVLSKLKERFGYSYRENGNCISFMDVNIGGFEYEFAEFHFSRNGLCYVQLQKHFDVNKFDKAKIFRDNIASSYGRKYKNIKSRIDDRTKIKYYVCGMMENRKYPIVIDLIKSTSKGGQTFYYVTVDYFTMDDAVNDDI